MCFYVYKVEDVQLVGIQFVSATPQLCTYCFSLLGVNYMQSICLFYASVCGLSLQFTFLCFVKFLASEVFMQSICLFYAGPRWNIRCAPDEVAVMMSKLTEEQKCVFVHDYHLSNLLDIKLTSSGPPSLIKRLCCNRAVQFIRAQVLKPLPRQLVCCT